MKEIVSSTFRVMMPNVHPLWTDALVETLAIITSTSVMILTAKLWGVL